MSFYEAVPGPFLGSLLLEQRSCPYSTARPGRLTACPLRQPRSPGRPPDGVISMLERNRDRRCGSGRIGRPSQRTIVLATNSSGIATILRIRRSPRWNVCHDPLPEFGGVIWSDWVRREPGHFSPRRFLFTKLQRWGNPAQSGGNFCQRDLTGFARDLWTGTTGALAAWTATAPLLLVFAVPGGASAATFCHLFEGSTGALWIGNLRARPLSP